MRLLHTADWHIGQTLNGWTREAEHAAFLAELADIVEARAVDALVIAGDVFDGPNPSGEALRMLYAALAGMRARRPGLTTVMVAGNHDPASRLEAPDPVLRAIGVHAVGTLHRQDGRIDMGRHAVPLPGPDGAPGALALAIPFLRAADMPGLTLADGEGGPGSPVVAATAAVYAEAAAAAAGSGLPVIATGHLHCAGGTESEGAERRILVGGVHAVPPEIFPATLAYVALGHLHRPQTLGGGRVRYAGAPFPLSATEIGYRHGVTLVEIGAGSVGATHLALARPVACLRVPETGALGPAALDAALAALALDPATPRSGQPFVYVALEPGAPGTGPLAEAEAVLARHPVRCAGLRLERPERVAESVAPPASLAETSPEALFERAFEAAHGEPPGPAHRAAFAEALAEP